MPEDDDRQLWLRARCGERPAFDRIQQSLAEPVAHFARRLLGPCERVEEICQDAFLALWLNLGRLDGAAHVRPFLFRVVRNLCYDELRRQRRFDPVPVEEGAAVSAELEWVAARQRSPEDDLGWSLAWARVERAMQGLPEPQRQALILRFELGLSYAEVAEATGVDPGTAKSRIHYGRRNLRRLLGPQFLVSLEMADSPSSAEEPQCQTTPTCAP